MSLAFIRETFSVKTFWSDRKMSELLGAKSEEYSGWSRKVQPIFIFFLILFLTVCCFALSWRRATGFTLTSTEHYSTKHLWIRCSGWMYICAIISSLRFKNAVRIITSRPNTGTACSIFTIELSFGGRFLRFILVGHCRI